jgi:hypothetical protein
MGNTKAIISDTNIRVPKVLHNQMLNQYFRPIKHKTKIFTVTHCDFFHMDGVVPVSMWTKSQIKDVLFETFILVSRSIYF